MITCDHAAAALELDQRDEPRSRKDDVALDIVVLVVLLVGADCLLLEAARWRGSAAAASEPSFE
jgi:hypothetical protein